MKKTAMITCSFMFFLFLTGPMMVGAQSDDSAQANFELLEVAKEKLRERTLQSGTLDIYDGDQNKVRNLRKIKIRDNIEERKGRYIILADYRDINTGEIVIVEIGMVSGEDDFTLNSVQIKDVVSIVKGEAQEAKDYSDSEIQDFMMDYVKKQGQFNDGKVMLFDKDNEMMRDLKLTELKAEVRRMGVFYSSSSQFVDTKTNDILDIDISVQNKDGKLKVQALRIRGVRQGLVGKEISK